MGLFDRIRRVKKQSAPPDLTQALLSNDQVEQQRERRRCPESARDTAAIGAESVGFAAPLFAGALFPIFEGFADAAGASIVVRLYLLLTIFVMAGVFVFGRTGTFSAMRSHARKHTPPKPTSTPSDEHILISTQQQLQEAERQVEDLSRSNIRRLPLSRYFTDPVIGGLEVTGMTILGGVMMFGLNAPTVIISAIIGAGSAVTEFAAGTLMHQMPVVYIENKNASHSRRVLNFFKRLGQTHAMAILAAASATSVARTYWRLILSQDMPLIISGPVTGVLYLAHCLFSTRTHTLIIGSNKRPINTIRASSAISATGQALTYYNQLLQCTLNIDELANSGRRLVFTPGLIVGLSVPSILLSPAVFYLVYQYASDLLKQSYELSQLQRAVDAGVYDIEARRVTESPGSAIQTCGIFCCGRRKAPDLRADILLSNILPIPTPQELAKEQPLDDTGILEFMRTEQTQPSTAGLRA